jgi:alkylhydroperoxidase/carboxymuconolactone decarboxylase family protein YurZ
VRAFQPRGFDRRSALLAELDPSFARTWVDDLGGLLDRPHLDRETRIIVLAGQFTITRSLDYLRDLVECAVAERADLRKVLESILQTFVYGGSVVLDAALEIFREVVDRHGLLNAVIAAAPPIELHDRDIDAERTAWHRADAADPRADRLLADYGVGVSTGLRLRPQFALDNFEWYEAVDPAFTALWIETVYHRMFNREIIDHKTRLLCMIGNLIAIGETIQSRHHMRGVLRQGGRPREVLEVAFQGCALFGHAHMLGSAVRDFVGILDELGLPIDEVAEPATEV